MFERFTDRARRVLVLAQEEARLLNHGGEGVAVQVLVKLGADPNAIRQQVIRILAGYQGDDADDD